MTDTEEIVVLKVAPTDRLPVNMRWMIRRDLSDVLRIEAASFEYAWTEEDFITCLRRRDAIGMVAETRATDDAESEIVGFFIYELHKKRIQVINLAVDPAHRRRGIGIQMLDKLALKAISHRRNRVTVAIRERNLSAQLFYRACNFLAERTLRKYYEDSGEDAIFMAYNCEDANAD